MEPKTKIATTGGKMKVFVELTFFAGSSNRPTLRDKIHELEDVGATGVSLWDHIFVSEDGPRRNSPTRPCDPLTTLAAIAGLSDCLELQTVVANSHWIHPALLLRQFSQLALLLGGERVTAGLGAGWNREEFDALGLDMPPLSKRLDRLEETLHVARQLYQDGMSTFAGEYVQTRDLPASPVFGTAPSLLVGGSSDRIMAMAGRYADVVDIVGTVLKKGPDSGQTIFEKHVNARARQARTTSADLAERMQLVREAAQEAGRADNSVRSSVQIYYTAFGSSEKEIAYAEQELCAKWAFIPPQSLRECPFVLLGSPQRMAEDLLERQERFGLSQIQLQERVEVSSARADPVRFCREVVPWLS